ncbi:MAG: ATP-dependent DNA helicase RecG [Bifidobacteriaceae bacterium]|nr:ATP-dependent DNA helicase RecG [Bifidobacteriaceae bacterium]
MSITLQTPISSCISQARRISAFKKIGIQTVQDALTYYPFRVMPALPLRSISNSQVGQKIVCLGYVQDIRVIPMSMRYGMRLQITVTDAYEQGSSQQLDQTQIIFFSYKTHYVQWMQSRIQVGMTIAISGEIGEYAGQKQFMHPEILTIQNAESESDNNEQSGIAHPNVTYDVATVDEAVQALTKPRPVYHANSRISSQTIHEQILAIIHALDDEDVPDILPEHVIAQNQLMHHFEAYKAIHNPQTEQEFYEGLRTLRFEEAFITQVAVLQVALQNNKNEAPVCNDETVEQAFIGNLPFTLTQGQQQVLHEIQEDMSQATPMQRLLQGEVGSGKTIIALLAMLRAAGSGCQSIMVAPTQVLAEQHYHNITSMVEQVEVEDKPLPVLLLTGGMRLAQRRQVLATIASGVPCIIVATHAAFSKQIQAPSLGLVVIDEQHRFGVKQREALRDSGSKVPHMLIMTATPIPRTAAMTWFGDLEVSTLTELPGGRKPIKTYVIDEHNPMQIAKVFTHIRNRVLAGERAYIVCSRIDDTQVEDLQETMPDMYDVENDDPQEVYEKIQPHSVHEISARLRKLPQFQGITVSTLTGKDSDEDKQQIMSDFAAGRIQVLISTVVIEVGVDVPQASCIVIFDADYFGLSQLHQLRGRVGRGGTNSWAFLVTQRADNPLASQRLQVIEGTLDGAKIAQADLELRGAGDVLGDSQSGGRSALKLLRVVKDADMIEQARAQAKTLLQEDEMLTQYPQLSGAVLDFMRGEEIHIINS